MIWPLDRLLERYKLWKLRQDDPYIYEEDEDEYVEEKK